MKRSIVAIIAGMALATGTSVASAQTPQADACYGLTLAYQANPSPALVRVAMDVGCLVAPAFPPPPVVVPVVVPVTRTFVVPVTVPFMLP